MSEPVPYPATPSAATADDSTRHRTDLTESRVPTCIANLDRALMITQANQDFVNQFQMPAAWIYGRSFCDLVHPTQLTTLRQEFTGLVTGRRDRFVHHMTAVLPITGSLSGELTGTVVRGADSTVSGVMVLMRPDRPKPTVPGQRSMPLLSEIDARILEGIAAGASTVQLASKLYLSRQGVEYHVSSMLRKLQVPNRAALVSKAYSLGVLQLGVWPPVTLAQHIR